MVAEYFGVFAIVGGTVLLGCAIAYGMLTNRNLSRDEREMQDCDCECLQHPARRRHTQLTSHNKGERYAKSGPQIRFRHG